MRKPKPKKAAAKKWPRINARVAAKVLKVVDAGLVSGVGNAILGQMCVEAAVCYAMGEPHGDQPKCVLEGIRDIKISLNDHEAWGREWLDNTAKVRSKGLRRLAIAQLGSKGVITDEQWRTTLREYYYKCNPGQTNPAEKRKQEQAAKLKTDEHALLTALKALKAGKPYDVAIDYYPDDYSDPYDDRDYNERIVEDIGSLPALKKVCADMVKILTKLGSPGTKYLYLTK